MVKDDIEQAKKIISCRDEKHYKENFFYSLYPFSNENLKAYFKSQDFNGKRALTLGSSGDQILNLISLGCEDVTSFDINPFVRYYYELKKASIMGLNRSEYLKFLYQRKYLLTKFKDLSDLSLFKSIRHYMDSDSILFWESLFDEFGIHQVKQWFFIKDSLFKENIIKNNGYLDYEDFSNIRGKLEKSRVSFVTDDIRNIVNIDSSFDFMFLSNVLDYVFDFHLKEYDEITKCMGEYGSFVDSIIDMLNKNGKLFFHYVWDYSFCDYSIIVYNHFRDDDNVSKMLIPSSDGVRNENDCVFVYKKS